MSCNNAYMKSAQCAYNNTEQTTAASGTTLAILGTQVCDTGVSIDTGTNGFTIERGGLFRFSYDAVFTADAAGDAVLQLYNGVLPLPCAATTVTAADAGTYALHAETVIRLGSCCGNKPVISAQMIGVAGTVTHVCANAVKLA